MWCAYLGTVECRTLDILSMLYPIWLPCSQASDNPISPHSSKSQFWGVARDQTIFLYAITKGRCDYNGIWPSPYLKNKIKTFMFLGYSPKFCRNEQSSPGAPATQNNIFSDENPQPFPFKRRETRTTSLRWPFNLGSPSRRSQWERGGFGGQGFLVLFSFFKRQRWRFLLPRVYFRARQVFGGLRQFRRTFGVELRK